MYLLFTFDLWWSSFYSKEIIKVLERPQDLDEWTLRISWLDLKLMFEQHRGGSAIELNAWMDSVAQAVINVFQQDGETELNQKQK